MPAVVALLSMLLAALPAAGAPPEPMRQWGLGTTVGGGFGRDITVATRRAGAATGALVTLPSVEARYFSRAGWSIDLHFPLSSNALDVGIKELDFAWIGDALFNANLGHGSLRWLLGAGLGAAVYAGGGIGAHGGVRVPALFGVELLTRTRHFGFQLLARGYLAINFGPAEFVDRIGGGATLALGVIWYRLR